MYSTQRDKMILKYIEEHGCLSRKNAAILFFKNDKHVSETMNRLLKQKKIKKYTTNYPFKRRQEIIYILPGQKKVKEHELLIEDCQYYLISKGATILNVSKSVTFPLMYKENHKFHKFIKPDLCIKFMKEGKIYSIVLEIDYTHFTGQDKQEELNKHKDKIQEVLKQQELYDPSWRIVIATNEEGYKINNRRFLYTDLSFKGLMEQLITLHI